MFLSDSKVTFPPFIKICKFSRFIFCFSVSVCSVVIGCVVFLYSGVDGSFRLDCSCLSILTVFDIVLLSRPLLVFGCIYCISRLGKKRFYYFSNLVSEVCGLKTSIFLPDFYHSFPIPSLRRVAHHCVSWLSFLVQVLCLCLWFVWFLKSLFVYLKKEPPKFAGWRLGLHCWLLREHLPNMTPRRVALVQRGVIFWFNIFIIGGILWLYHT